MTPESTSTLWFQIAWDSLRITWKRPCEPLCRIFVADSPCQALYVVPVRNVSKAIGSSIPNFTLNNWYNKTWTHGSCIIALLTLINFIGKVGFRPAMLFFLEFLNCCFPSLCAQWASNIFMSQRCDHTQHSHQAYFCTDERGWESEASSVIQFVDSSWFPSLRMS